MQREYAIQLAKLNRLSLTEWFRLAKELGVRMNDKEGAAKKLVLRNR